MKRFWICAALLVVLFTAAQWHTWYVQETTDRIADTLNRAEAAVAEKDWDTARALTEEAQSLWERRQGYLSISLRLCDTDEVSTGFEAVLGYLQWEAAPEYDGANGTLVAYVQHLAETEQVNWRNLL